MQYFNIQVASQLSGVASATIRAWEKRYHAVVPDRGDNGHRLYSEKDIEKLALLSRLTEVGQSIGKIAHLELTELKDVYTTLMHEPYIERQVVAPHQDKIDFEKILLNLQLALDAYKVDVISHELEKAQSALSPRELCLNIIIPLFGEIGRKIEHKQLSIAQEHTLSALTVFYLGRMLGDHYQKGHERNELILLATPEHELHEIGILSAALLCAHYGWKVIYLGSNLPAASLAEAANQLRPKAIILGTSGPVDSYLQELQSGFPGKTEVWVGGPLGPEDLQSLKKRRVGHFPSLTALDEFLARF